MILQTCVYALVVAGAATTVFTRDVRKLPFVFGFYGSALVLLFLLLQAPDVAISEAVVGSVAAPLVLLVALARMGQRG